MWRDYVAHAHSCCAPSFWKLYNAVKGQTVTCRDAVMHAVKDLVPTHVARQGWPRSNRTLRRRVERRAGKFWDLVVQTHTIDLREYELPGVDSVQFSFLDPIYVWINRCNVLRECRIPLQWDAQKLYHPDTDEEVHGAGIQYSLLFRSAYESIPQNGKLALINISWDGGQTGFGSRSAVPILLKVMNTNSNSTKVVGLLGYLPYVEVAPGYKEHKDFVNAKLHVLQVCLRAFLTCLQTCLSTCFFDMSTNMFVYMHF